MQFSVTGRCGFCHSVTLYKGLDWSQSLNPTCLWVSPIPFTEDVQHLPLPSKHNYPLVNLKSFPCIHQLSGELVPRSFLCCGEGVTLVFSIWAPLDGHKALAKIAQEQVTDILLLKYVLCSGAAY